MLMIHKRRPSFSCRPEIPTITPAMQHATGAMYIAKKKSLPKIPTACPPNMMKGDNGHATVNDAATILVLLNRCFAAGDSGVFNDSRTVAAIRSSVNPAFPESCSCSEITRHSSISMSKRKKYESLFRDGVCLTSRAAVWTVDGEDEHGYATHICRSNGAE